MNVNCDVDVYENVVDFFCVCVKFNVAMKILKTFVAFDERARVVVKIVVDVFIVVLVLRFMFFEFWIVIIIDVIFLFEGVFDVVEFFFFAFCRFFSARARFVVDFFCVFFFVDFDVVFVCVLK